MFWPNGPWPKHSCNSRTGKTHVVQASNPKDAALTPIISYKGLKGKCCILSCRFYKFRKRICSTGTCLWLHLSTHASSSMNSFNVKPSLCFVGGSMIQHARKRETETKREGELPWASHKCIAVEIDRGNPIMPVSSRNQ